MEPERPDWHDDWRKKPTVPWWRSLPAWQLAVIVFLVIAVAVAYALGWF